MDRDKEYLRNENVHYENYNRSSKKSSSTSNINFLTFLGTEVPYDYKLKKPKFRKTPHEPMVFEIDDGYKFRNTVSITKGGGSASNSISSTSKTIGIRDFTKKKQLEAEITKQFDKTMGPIKQHVVAPIEVVDWESQIFEMNDQDENVQTNEYINELLDSGWEKNICIDPNTTNLCKNYMTLYIDDPNLIFEKVEEKKTKNKKKTSKTQNIDKPSKNKYNISNDKYYVSEIKNKVSLGTFGVQHSLPALKLDAKFYKTNHTKDELRNFHRMPVIFPPSNQINEVYTFKQPFKVLNASSIIKKSSERTLSDNVNFAIFEYYEEFPFFITNPGMASLMNTYYRRTDSSDEPDAENAISLDVEEESQ
jgi:hypothetical protein